MMINEVKPFISVIMPVYNRGQTVRSAIESVLRQSYQNFELVIIDDASTDSTSVIVNSIQDERIKYVRLKSRAGASAARNVGIRIAQANWIAFQDSDDIWEPQKLEKQVRCLNEYQGEYLPIIYTSFYRYRNNRREYIPGKDKRNKNGFIHSELLLENFISTQTVLLAKESLLNVGGFSEDMPRFQDWELWIRLSREHPFIWIDEPLVHVYYTDSSISSSQVKLIQAYEKIIEKHLEDFQRAGTRYLANLYFSYGHNLCLDGEMSRGRNQLWKSLKQNPWSLRCYIAIICTITGSKGYQYLYRLLNRG